MIFFCNICFLYIFAVYYLTELSIYLAVYFVLSKLDAMIEVLFYLNCKYFLFLLQASNHWSNCENKVTFKRVIKNPAKLYGQVF